MNICIPMSANSQVTNNLQNSTHYIFYDIESKEKSIFSKPALDDMFEDSGVSLLDGLIEKGLTAVICKTLPPMSHYLLTEKGITIYTATDESVDNLFTMYENNRLQRMSFTYAASNCTSNCSTCSSECKTD
jgi:predicted Fe-Mo cluster-binding NifX family protein